MSTNGRSPGFEPDNLGSNPSEAALPNKQTQHMAKKDDNSIQDALQALDKKYGANSVMKLAKGNQAVNIEVLPTGVYSIDKILGGGIARGRIVEFYGNEGSGKTTLALMAIAEAQKMGHKCAFIDVEQSFSMEYAAALGVDVEELYFSQPMSAEEALDVSRTLAETGQFAIIVLDSVAALQPEKDSENLGRSQIGMMALFLSNGLRQCLTAFSKSKTVFVLINQIRMNIGVSFGNPETTPGGKALKFYASQRVELKTSQKIVEGEEHIGNTVKVRVVKNKVALPNRKAEVAMYYGKGFNVAYDIFTLAEQFNVITKEKATYYFGEQKLAVGHGATLRFLQENVDIMNAIKAKLDVIYLP